VNTITFKQGANTRLTTSKNYDNLNRLTSIHSVNSANSVQNFDYSYNSANQRTKSISADGSYWDYQYDSFGQVTSGVKKLSDGTAINGEQFGYSFDSIGNRLATVVNGQSATYAANNLNQYSQRTVPGKVDIFGTADAGSTVTVNNQATTRQDEYFFKSLDSDNSVNSAYGSLTIVGVKK